jgi:hypothetical protein
MALAPTDAPDTDATADATNDADTGADTDEGQDSDIIVTIARGTDGGYIVYQGDEPEGGGAMGGAGAAAGSRWTLSARPSKRRWTS